MFEGSHSLWLESFIYNTQTNQSNTETVANDSHWSIGLIIGLAFLTLFLILLASFFSCTETALTSITKVKWKSESGNIKSKKIVNIVYKMINNYTMTLGSNLIGSALVNTASSTVAGLLFSGVVRYVGAGSHAEAIGTGVATGVMTLLILIFGEFLPKNFAKKNPIKLLTWFGYPIYFFYLVFWPFTWLLNRIFNRKEKTTKTTIEELKSLVDVIKYEGTLDSQEALIINKAILFDEILIKQKMVGWDKVVKVNENDLVKDVIPTFLETGFSRLVVINEDQEVVGIAHIKVVIKAYLNDQNTPIDSIMHSPMLITKNDTLYDGLRMMQIQQIHLAIVVDNLTEKNPVGIITLENITEELTGNVFDETDLSDANEWVQEVNEYTWKLDAKANAKKFLTEKINASIEVADDLSMGKYVSKLNKNRKFMNRQLIDTEHMYIEVFKDVKSNRFIFLIEKKIKEDSEL